MTSIGGNSKIPHPPRDFQNKSRGTLSRFAPSARPRTRERDKIDSFNPGAEFELCIWGKSWRGRLCPRIETIDFRKPARCWPP